jgi:hypothetical protein
MAQSASRAEVSSKRVFGIRTRPRTDYVLSTAGTVALLALAYYLLKHGLNLTDGVRLLLFSLPVALAAVAGLLFSSLLLPPRRKPLIVVLAVVAIIGVYATDFLLGSASPAWSGAPMWNFDRSSPRARQEVAALARSFGVEIDSRDRDERLNAFKSSGVEAVPALMLADILTSDPTLRIWHANAGQEMLPLAGISGTTTVLCNETGQFVTYTSDEHGFRNPSGVWTSARADLAALGQSLTQGYCVPNGKGFVDLLRPRYPVTLNLGMSGQSSLLQLAAIKEYLQTLRPKSVLWFYTEGIDLPDLYEESRHRLLLRYLEPAFSQNLVDRQSQIDRAVRHFQSDQSAQSSLPESGSETYAFPRLSLDHLKLWHLRYKLDLMFGSNGIDTRAWSTLDLFRETLSQARMVTSGWGGRLYFVYLPSWTRYRNSATVPAREHAAVLKIVHELQIPVIDIEPAFSSHEDPLSLFPFRRFGHYNEAGNRIVATTVLRSLSRGSGDDRDHGEPPPTATFSKAQ